MLAQPSPVPPNLFKSRAPPGTSPDPRGLQRGNGVARLVFFPESDHGIGHKQQENDAKVRPMPGNRRKDHGRFDHPWDGTPEIAEEFQERTGFLFFNLVRPVLDQPLFRLGLTEAIRRRPQFFLHFRQGQGFQIVLRIGLRCGRIGIGFHNEYSLCPCHAAGVVSCGMLVIMLVPFAAEVPTLRPTTSVPQRRQRDRSIEPSLS